MKFFRLKTIGTSYGIPYRKAMGYADRMKAWPIETFKTQAFLGRVTKPEFQGGNA